MYLEYPKDIPLTTVLGNVKVSITEANHAYVQGTFTLNSSAINGALHLFKHNQWTDKDSEGKSTIYTSKAGSLSSATKLQEQKIVTAIMESVVPWLEAHPELLREAQKAHVHNKVEGIRDKMSELYKELAEHEQEIKDLEATLE